MPVLYHQTGAIGTLTLLKIVREQRPTLRQLLGSWLAPFVMTGTPEQVADTMEDWIDSGAADPTLAEQRLIRIVEIDKQAAA